MRITGRLGWTHRRSPGSAPAWPESLDIPIGLAPRALRDIEAGRPRAASLFPMPRSRSAPQPAACSGSSGCASGTRSASRRPPSTSSPRPICACSVSPPTKPPASPPSPSRTPGTWRASLSAASGGQCPGTGPRRSGRRGGGTQSAAVVRNPPAALRVRISSRHPGASPSARLPLPGHPPRSQGSRG